MHPSNCLGFALFAEQQSCHTLFQLSTSYTSQHFMQVCKNQEFYQLTAEQLVQLLKSDDLNVPTEEEVFHALMAWIQYDFDAREKFIPELLGLIRLPLLPPAVSIHQFLFNLHLLAEGEKKTDIHFQRSTFSSSLLIMWKICAHQVNVNSL